MLYSNEQKLSHSYYYLFAPLLLLISCGVFANINKETQFTNNLASAHEINQEFTKLINKVKKLKDSDSFAALTLLNTAQRNVEKLSVIQQLTFYKFQSELDAELAKYKLSKKSANKGLKIADSLKKPSALVVELLYNRGFATEMLDDLQAASEDYLNGLDIAQSLNDQQLIAQGLINIGAIYYQTERYKLALTVFNDALKIANSLKDEDLQGYINTELGILYAYIGQVDQSLKFYRTAYQHYINIGKTAYAVNALSNIADSYQGHERYEEAIKIYKELIPSVKKMANSEAFYTLYMGLSWSYLNKKEPDTESSYQYLRIAEQYLPEVERGFAKLNFLIQKGYVLEGMRRYDEALDALTQAEKLISSKEKSANNLNYLSIIGLKATIYRALGHYETGYKLYSKYTDGFIDYYKHERTAAIQDIRLRYESERAELQAKGLKKKSSLQSLELLKVENSRQQQKMYFLFIALVVVIFAWLLHRLVRGQHRLLYSSRIDNLTGLTNRRRLMQLGAKLLKKAQIEQSPFSLLMIDIDNFKKINDQYGHNQGDMVLQKIAEIGTNLLRKTDVFARFGGEEFIVLLPNTNKEQALSSAQRLRSLIESTDWDNVGKVTISVGVATLSNEDITKFNQKNDIKKAFEQLIKVADDLLYQAKYQGRNKVCV